LLDSSLNTVFPRREAVSSNRGPGICSKLGVTAKGTGSQGQSWRIGSSHWDSGRRRVSQ